MLIISLQLNFMQTLCTPAVLSATKIVFVSFVVDKLMGKQRADVSELINLIWFAAQV